MELVFGAIQVIWAAADLLMSGLWLLSRWGLPLTLVLGGIFMLGGIDGPWSHAGWVVVVMGFVALIHADKRTDILA
jgi:hypothetical protein